MSGGTVRRESQCPGVGHHLSKIEFHAEINVARVDTVLEMLDLSSF